MTNNVQYTIKRLDKGFVRLVESMGNDLSIVRAARVSYDAEWRAGLDQGSDRRLIKYLWDNKHTTPFEAVEFQFDVKAPIFVLRQWHRHRTWSFNELSARYCELPEDYYVPFDWNICYQSGSNKQGRGDKVSEDAAKDVREKIDFCNSEAFATYRHLLNQGISRELARNVLPLGTYSHMFAKVNLLNLFKFITLRSDPHAQYEIRVYAEALLELARQVVPVAVGVFERDRPIPDRMPLLQIETDTSDTMPFNGE